MRTQTGRTKEHWYRQAWFYSYEKKSKQIFAKNISSSCYIYFFTNTHGRSGRWIPVSNNFPPISGLGYVLTEDSVEAFPSWSRRKKQKARHSELQNALLFVVDWPSSLVFFLPERRLTSTLYTSHSGEWSKALSTLETIVANLKRRQSPNSPTVAVFGDSRRKRRLSPNSETAAALNWRL